MQIYRTRVEQLHGSSYNEVIRRARSVYKTVAKQTRRQPYIRSRYFSNEKVFINSCWAHIHTKNYKDRFRRLKFLPCAFELLRNSRLDPEIKPNPNRPHSILYRFHGLTAKGERFVVHVERNEKTGLNTFYLFSLLAQTPL
jgi:hypothetical protein